mmetsp:Transcript_29343/g.95617  ORF Transcript_29343/g.95617 Transcript_29343/m.95617 type:complete len:178 (+) Transcript_29343:1182-1715(+)
MDESEQLPKAHIKRLVKSKVAEVTEAEAGPAAEGDKKKEVNIQKEALQAFQESGKLFIHYLTAAANDVCTEKKRSTIQAEDVLAALEELEFGDLAEPLREALAAFRREASQKAASRKRKAAGPPGAATPAPAGDAEVTAGAGLSPGVEAGAGEPTTVDEAPAPAPADAEDEAQPMTE